MSKLKVANIVFNSFTNDSRVLKESISLANHGYDVEVIAHLDKNLEAEEKKENFLIKRFSYLDRQVTKSKIGKLKAYYRYVKESLRYCKDFDILHCNDLNTLPIAYLVKKFYNKKIKVIYDAHEYETETNMLKGFQKSLAKFMEKFLIRDVDVVLTVSELIAKEYMRLYGISKPILILNTPKYQSVEKKNIFRDTFGIAHDTSIFLYQGALTYGRGVEKLLEASTQMTNKKSVIVFMGYGPLEDKIIEAAQLYENIYFHKAVEPNVILDYTSSADFGISMIEDSCLSYRYCLPNKLFEYMMAEVPVIVSNLPEMKKLVEEYEVGVVVQGSNSEAIEDAFMKVKLLDEKRLKENIQEVKSLYNWEEQEKKLLAVYDSLMATKSEQ